MCALICIKISLRHADRASLGVLLICWYMLVLRALCGRRSQPKARVDLAKLTDFLYKSHFGTCKNYMSGSLRRRNCVKLYFVTLPASGILKLFFECSSVMANERLTENVLELFVMNAHWFLLFVVLVVVIGLLHFNIRIPSWGLTFLLTFVDKI